MRRPTPTPRAAHGQEDAAHAQLSPSASFVLSPEAGAKANLEVWSEGTLLVNVSNPRPVFLVRGLPPAAPLKLVLYSATPHSRSTPVLLYTRTLPRSTFPVTALPPSPGPESREMEEGTLSTDGGLGGGLGVAIGGLVGGVGLTLLVLVLVILLMRRRQRRRAALEDLVAAPASEAIETPKVVEKTVEVEAVVTESLELPITPRPPARPVPHTRPVRLTPPV
ncbi:uncharacterized protein LOC135094690 [Scylla paramamosain]|uniref:uncharacterized protein LOC135094690 n=1 Tax=Scylla paramamosain TaxID=85552 RepID=UPI00308288EE